jgi:D-proline reductase (dithiol) PrdB
MEMSRKAIPYTPNSKPLSEMTIGIVSTAGAHLRDQEPFNEDQTTGDITYRIIPQDASSSDFSVSHAAPKHEYNTDEPKKDINTIFPIDLLRQLKEEGVIGGIADNHFSMMGFAMKLRKLIDETIPELAKKVERSKADAIILTAG